MKQKTSWWEAPSIMITIQNEKTYGWLSLVYFLIVWLNTNSDVLQHTMSGHIVLLHIFMWWDSRIGFEFLCGKLYLKTLVLFVISAGTSWPTLFRLLLLTVVAVLGVSLRHLGGVLFAWQLGGVLVRCSSRPYYLEYSLENYCGWYDYHRQ